MYGEGVENVWNKWVHIVWILVKGRNRSDSSPRIWDLHIFVFYVQWTTLVSGPHFIVDSKPLVAAMATHLKYVSDCQVSIANPRTWVTHSFDCDFTMPLQLFKIIKLYICLRDFKFSGDKCKEKNLRGVASSRIMRKKRQKYSWR